MRTQNDLGRLVGLFVFLFVVLVGSSSSWAAVTVTPSMPQWIANAHNIANGLRAFNAGELPYNPSTGYAATGTTTIGGKALSIPAKVPLAAGAGAIAKTAMRANPALLAGTLALPWLIEQGLEYANGWQVVTVEDGPTSAEIAACPGMPLYTGGGGTYCNDVARAACPGETQIWSVQWFSGGTPQRTNGEADCYPSRIKKPVWVCNAANCVAAQSGTRPATDTDWDNLPDPTSTVAPELPTAPYMGEKGAPVGKPEYTSGNYPLGSPYKAPDGTTVQPMASVTNVTNTNTVNVSTYNITTHNADGTPTNNPTPTPTDEKPDECEAHPDTVGCTKLGELPTAEVLPRSDVPITFNPVEIAENATCPAPSTVAAFGQSFALEYDSACTYATGLKPVVIAVAYLTALFIIFGAPRSAQS